MFGSSDTEKSLSSSPKSRSTKWDGASERRSSLTGQSNLSGSSGTSAVFTQTSTDSNSLRAVAPDKQAVQSKSLT